MKQIKKITGADLIIVLFLIVTIPHTAMILSAFEYKDWGLLAWSLAGAVDIGIAYGGVISANINADKEARQWATALFVGLSVGSYSLNVAHYVAFHAGLYSIGLGAFFPIGILLLAKIKSRLHNSKQINLENIAPAPIDYAESLAARDEVDRLKNLLTDKDNELARISQNYQLSLTGMQNELTTRKPDLSIYRDRLIEIGKARLNKNQLEDAIDGLLAEIKPA